MNCKWQVNFKCTRDRSVYAGMCREFKYWQPKKPTETPVYTATEAMEKECRNCKFYEKALAEIPCSDCVDEFVNNRHAFSKWQSKEPTKKPVYTATETQVNKVFDEALKIVQERNKRYGDAWKYYRTGTFIDRILVKAMRLQQMDLNGDPIPDLRECFLDIINECAFGVIKLEGWHEGGNKID